MKKFGFMLPAAIMLALFASCGVLEEAADKAGVDKVSDLTQAVADQAGVDLPGVKGKILDNEGKPVENVTVRSWNMVTYLPGIATDKTIIDKKGRVNVQKLEDPNGPYPPKTVQTEADGTFVITGPGGYILTFEKECYTKVVKGIKANRQIPTKAEDAVYSLNKSAEVNIAMNFTCAVVAPVAPPADSVPAPLPADQAEPPAEPEVEIIGDNGEPVKATPAQVAENTWVKFVVTEADNPSNSIDASADNQTMARPGSGIVNVTGQAPSGYKEKSVVLVTDIEQEDGTMSRALTKVALKSDKTFETISKLIAGKKTLLSMAYPSTNYKQPAPINQSYVVTVTDEGGKVPHFTVTLTWDKHSETVLEYDLDLHVVALDQNNSEIDWTNMNTGWGFLDIDNMNGFGPEVVTIDTSAASGEGKVKVYIHAYEIKEATVAKVRISTPKCDKTFVDDLDGDGQADNLKATDAMWEVGTFDINCQ